MRRRRRRRGASESVRSANIRSAVSPGINANTVEVEGGGGEAAFFLF